MKSDKNVLTRIEGVGWSVLAVVLAVAAVTPGAALGAPKITERFPYVKSLTPPATAFGTIGSFDLDEALFDATADLDAGLRVMGETGQETPFLVRPRKEKKTITVESPVEVSRLAFETPASNRIEVVWKKEHAEDRPSAVVFRSLHKNFEKQVTVYGSADRATWTPLTVNRPIFDYSRFMDVRNDRVEFGGSPYAFYKVEIANITETRQSPLYSVARQTREGRPFSEEEHAEFQRQDFRLEGVTFIETKASEVRATTMTNRVSALGVKVETSEGEKKTVVTFDTRRTPITQIRILTAVPNFSRSVRVEGSDEDGSRPAWRAVLSGTVSRLEAGAFRQDRATLVFGQANRFRHYRLTIENLDSPPLDIAGVEAVGEIHQALFFSKPGARYRVWYGAEELETPRYDIGDVLRNAETATTDAFVLGEQQANPDYRAARMRWDGRRLLIPVVILVVVVLGWVIVKSAKKLEGTPGTTDS